MPHLNRKRNWCNGANKSYDKSNYGDCLYILIKTALIQWLRRFYCVWLSQLTKLSSCPARWAPGLTPVARCSGVLSSPHLTMWHIMSPSPDTGWCSPWCFCLNYSWTSSTSRPPLPSSSSPSCSGVSPPWNTTAATSFMKRWHFNNKRFWVGERESHSNK